MNKKEALEFVSSVNWMGSRLGLERMRQLMSLLGDPQEKLKCIHVAGTNGKGSASMMLSSILIASGAKTALYTSPHLSEYNERFIINNRMIDDDRFSIIAEKVKRACDMMDEKPTEFETVTAMAFLYFAEEECDYVVLEVGLGGRLDATNVISKPVLSLIMNIGLEHTQILGDTIEKIAYEKAGIIKEGIPCVAYNSCMEAVNVFRKVTEEKHSSLTVTDPEAIVLKSSSLSLQCFDYRERKNLEIGLLGNHQLRNAAAVLDAVDVLNENGAGISETAIVNGLRSAFWPARLEILCNDPLFILDGAHNLQCATALSESLDTILHGNKCIFLMGVLADKDYNAITDLMIPFGSRFVCVTPDSNRALSAEDLKDHLSAKGAIAETAASVGEGIKRVLELSDGTPIVAFGSLYMAGAIRDLFPSIYRKHIRKRMTDIRSQLSEEEIMARSKTVCSSIRELDCYKSAKTVMIYKPVRGEADLSFLESDDKTFVYPVCDDVIRASKADNGFVCGKYGIPEPSTNNEAVDINDIDLIICPLVAYDDNNQRLGMGKGYYDRYLSTYNGAKIGVAYSFQRVHDLYPEIHDIKMDIVVAG